MPAEFIWTPEIEDEICDAIASGQSLDEACLKAGMPSDTTVYRRMAKDDAFAGKMAAARAAQQDHEVEHCIKIADQATPEDVQVAKLRIWARQWRAGKLNPKKYGDKVTNIVSDPNGKPVDMAPRFVILPAPQPPAVTDDAADAD